MLNHHVRRARQEDDFGPVTLHYCDGPMWMPSKRLAMIQSRRCETNAEALALATKLFRTDQFHHPYVCDDNNTIWVEHELRARCR
jgi:hypothetical protein